MTGRVALGGLLLVLAAAPVAAQRLAHPADGVVLREAGDITFFEHLRILAKRALVPGSRVVAPLHAYSSALACDGERRSALLGHEGSAALVARMGGDAVAFYYRSADEALTATRDDGWCAVADADRWYFATTLPLRGSRETAVAHYVSLDVGRVDAHLARE